MPIMASLRLIDNGKGSRMDFNLGGYIDYFISGKQKQIIDTIFFIGDVFVLIKIMKVDVLQLLSGRR